MSHSKAAWNLTQMNVRILLLVLSLHSFQAIASDIFDYGVHSFEPMLNDRNFLVTANDIVEAPDGRIWIGGQRGIFYLDGKRLVKPYSLDQREDNFHYYFISKIWFDESGDMFVGTKTRGVFRFDSNHGQWTSLIEETPMDSAEHPLRAHVLDFSQADADRIWISTNKQLCIYNKVQPKLECKNTISGHSLQNITNLHSSSNSLYITTDDKLLELPYMGKAPSFDHEAQLILEDIRISSMVPDEQQRLWLATADQGVFILGLDKVASRIPDSPNAADLLIHEDKVWLATKNQGLQVLNYPSGIWSGEYQYDAKTPYGLPYGSISKLLVDKSGMLSMIINGTGIYRTNVENKAVRLLTSSKRTNTSPSENNIRFIKETENGDIWLAVFGLGVDVINPINNTKRHYAVEAGKPNTLKKSDIYSIAQDSSGQIWLASKSGGIYLYQSDTDDFRYFDASNGLISGGLNYLLALNNGDLLISGEHGVSRLKTSTREFFTVPLIGADGNALQAHIHMATQLDNGEIWLNGNQHFYRLNEDDKQAHLVELKMDDGSDLPLGIVIGPIEDRQGNLYLNMGGALLHRTSESETGEITLRLVESMFSSQMNSLISEDGFWWGYNHRIDGKTFQATKLESIDNVPMTANWIVSKETSHTGTMMFGSPAGMVMIKPEQYKQSDYNPPPLVLSISLDEKKRDYHKGPVIVPANVKSISFDFFSPNYSMPSKKHYAYRLVGYTNEWTTVDALNRKSTFTNLEPGSYQLELKSSNRHGIWQEDITQLQVVVEPQWFETYWFRSAASATLLLLIYNLYRYRVRHISKRSEELAHLVQERTYELENSLKELKQTQDELVQSEKMASLGRLVRGVAHEINTPLGIVRMAASNLSENISQTTHGEKKKPTIVQGSLELMEKNIHRISQLVSSFKDINPDEHDSEIKSFELGKVIEIASSTLNKELSNITVSLYGDKTQQVSTNHDAFIIVLKEILLNASRHAWPQNFDQEQKIDIHWEMQGEQLTLSISDNGTSIDTELSEKIFDPFFSAHNDPSCLGLGLHKVYLLVSQQLGGDVTYQKSDMGGSTFLLRMPI